MNHSTNLFNTTFLHIKLLFLVAQCVAVNLDLLYDSIEIHFILTQRFV